MAQALCLSGESATTYNMRWSLYNVPSVYFDLEPRSLLAKLFYIHWKYTVIASDQLSHSFFIFFKQIWKWQKTGRIYLAGEIALVAGLVIWVTSLPQIRRRKFEIFYYTHHLYTVFLVFFLFHAGDRHFYMVFSGIFLFSLDKLLRVIQSSPKTCIVSARIFPSKAVELILPKDPSIYSLYSNLKLTYRI